MSKYLYYTVSIVVLHLAFSGSAIAQLPDQFQKVELMSDISNPVQLEFAPDGRIFVLDRYGELLIYKPNLQTSVSAVTLEVFHGFEDGLIGIAFDPDFNNNQYLYLHYSPPDKSVNRVSRFSMNGDQLQLNSEVHMLEWGTQRTSCCHAGGDMGFDSKGNLYIATGDNTNHSLYAPLDETNSDLSAEKSSSNTNDLRGKILRITPQPDGSYTIPANNLFPGGIGGLPEIYVMGARNPFQMFIDKENTDWLFWGEVGPDANTEGSEGPEGLDEINLTKEAGNYGWPYFSGENQPYLNVYSSPQFYFDPTAPVNLSQWNTGATTLPPAQPSWLKLFHKSYLAGPRYYFDPALTDPQRLPLQFDEAFFYFDFNTSRIWVVKMDDSGNILSTTPFAPLVFPVEKFGFIDMKVGPDGHLYILEYGAGCCPYEVYGGKLMRVDYTGETVNTPPIINLSADRISGSLPLIVSFSSTGTSDPEGDPLTFNWDFQSDGIIDSQQENVSFTYTAVGVYQVTLTVSDGNNGVSSEYLTIHAGNDAATFNFNTPPDGGIIQWGDDINFQVAVSDIQDGSTADGSIDCNDVNIVTAVSNLGDTHQYGNVQPCQGSATLNATSTTSFNSGGPEINLQGHFYKQDQYANGGEIYSNQVAITGTDQDAIYQTERYGNFTYQIPVSQTGDYLIRLHFAEIYYGVQVSGGKGDRVFNVFIEGSQVLTNFDILNEVSPATALVKEFQVNVIDGQITIQLSSVKGDAKIAAIELINPNGFDIYGADNIFSVLQASYTDQGGLTSKQQIHLYPKRHESEFSEIQKDIVIVNNTDPWGGGKSSIRVHHGSYIGFTGRNLAGINSVNYRTSSGTNGGKIELRLDTPDGQLVSTTDIPASGGWDQWVDQESSITAPVGKHDLYFVFKNNPGNQDLLNLNYIEFGGTGVSMDKSPPEVLSVYSESASSVWVSFSEKVSKNSAEALSNYSIDQGVRINDASVAQDNRTVILSTSQLISGAGYQLSVREVQNIAGLTVEPDSYSFTAYAGNGNRNPLVPKLKLYPNPTTKEVTIEIELFTAESFFINIYESTGRTLYNDEVMLKTGRNKLILDLDTFTEGLYYLKVNSRGTNLSGQKLLIQNR